MRLPHLRPSSRGRSRCEEHELEICELGSHIAAATCRWLLLIAEFDQRGGWAEWGAKSCAHWLSYRCSIGLVAAREHVRVARRLLELPIVREAFRTGELSYCKVRAISRVATPETEQHLVDIGLHATGAQLEKVVRLFRGALQASTRAAQDLHARRELTYMWNDDGSLSLTARLAPDEGALVMAALKAAEEESSSAGDDSAESPPDEPAAARRADALVSLARGWLADVRASRPDGDPCEVSVHVDVNSLAAESVQDRCELSDGPTIAPETARRLSCDAPIVRIVERDGHPLSVGRRKWSVPAALRRALRSRDDGCRFPGCTHKRFLHAHHIHHWARGGQTELDNLIQLCSYHHRLVHEGGFGVERLGRRGVRFRRPDGRPIPEAARSVRLAGPDLRARHRLDGVCVDPNACMPRSMGDRLDYDLTIMGLCDEALAPT
jgi:uncharacterized protein DUF222/HNH endonuclease